MSSLKQEADEMCILIDTMSKAVADTCEGNHPFIVASACFNILIAALHLDGMEAEEMQPFKDVVAAKMIEEAGKLTIAKH